MNQLVADSTRRDIEKRSGKPVVAGENFKGLAGNRCSKCDAKGRDSNRGKSASEEGTSLNKQRDAQRIQSRYRTEPAIQNSSQHAVRNFDGATAWAVT